MVQLKEEQGNTAVAKTTLCGDGTPYVLWKSDKYDSFLTTFLNRCLNLELKVFNLPQVGHLEKMSFI